MQTEEFCTTVNVVKKFGLVLKPLVSAYTFPSHIRSVVVVVVNNYELSESVFAVQWRLSRACMQYATVAWLDISLQRG